MSTDRRLGQLIASAACLGPEVFAKALFDWYPHPGQHAWLKPRPAVLEEVLMTGRRWGKSEAEAVRTLHYAVRHPGSFQCIGSITLDQARLIWDQVVKFCYTPMLEPFLAKRPVETPFPFIRLMNGSTITARSVARNGLYIRGHKYHRFVVDEADYVPDRVIDEVIRMTLADYNGRLVLTTTPRPKRGLVFKTLQRAADGDPLVYAQHGSSFENGHISHDFIRAQQVRMTRGAWVREVLGQYADEDDAVYRWADIEAAYRDAGWSLNEPWKENRRYVLGADLAFAQDWTVIIVLDVTRAPYRLVYFDRFQRRPWPAVNAAIEKTAGAYRVKPSDAFIDSTGVGAGTLHALDRQVTGFNFTAQSKPALLTLLQLVMEQHQVQFPFVKQLVDELQMYAFDDKDLVTDCVMALALAVWAARNGRSRELKTFSGV